MCFCASAAVVIICLPPTGDRRQAFPGLSLHRAHHCAVIRHRMKTLCRESVRHATSKQTNLTLSLGGAASRGAIHAVPSMSPAAGRRLIRRDQRCSQIRQVYGGLFPRRIEVADLASASCVWGIQLPLPILGQANIRTSWYLYMHGANLLELVHSPAYRYAMITMGTVSKLATYM